MRVVLQEVEHDLPVGFLENIPRLAIDAENTRSLPLSSTNVKMFRCDNAFRLLVKCVERD